MPDKSKFMKYTKSCDQSMLMFSQKIVNTTRQYKFINVHNSTTWKTTWCSKLEKSTTTYTWEPPFFRLSRSFILSIALNVRRSSQSTGWICPLSYLFTSFSKRSSSPRSCCGTCRKITQRIEKRIKPFHRTTNAKS